jgi:hypothetical protein
LDFPSPGLPDAELEAWFADAGNRWRLLAGLNLGTLSAVAFLWFVGVLRNRIGDREDRFFGTVFYGSSIIYSALWVIALASLAAIPAAIGSGACRARSEPSALEQVNAEHNHTDHVVRSVVVEVFALHLAHQLIDIHRQLCAISGADVILQPAVIQLMKCLWVCQCGELIEEFRRFYGFYGFHPPILARRSADDCIGLRVPRSNSMSELEFASNTSGRVRLGRAPGWHSNG